MVESIATSFNISTGFPRDVFHPVYGKRTVNSFDDIKALPDLTRNWFATAADADAARTQPEADAVVAHHNAMQAQEMAQASMQSPEERGTKAPDIAEDDSRRHIVRNSVQAQEDANKMAADIVASGSASSDVEPGAVLAGPVAAPLVPAQPQATEGVEPAQDGPGAAKSAEDVSNLTREAAATDVIPQSGQAVDLAAGGTEDKTEPAQTRDRTAQPVDKRTGGGAPPADKPTETKPPNDTKSPRGL